MTEPEKSSYLSEISALTVRLGVGQLPTDSECSMRILVICSAVTQKKNKSAILTNVMLAELQ